MGPSQYAAQPAARAEMFPTRIRYSGVSLGYQVTSIDAGSLAPIIAVALLDRFSSVASDRSVPGGSMYRHRRRSILRA